MGLTMQGFFRHSKISSYSMRSTLLRQTFVVRPSAATFAIREATRLEFTRPGNCNPYIHNSRAGDSVSAPQQYYVPSTVSLKPHIR